MLPSPTHAGDACDLPRTYHPVHARRGDARVRHTHRHQAGPRRRPTPVPTAPLPPPAPPAPAAPPTPDRAQPAAKPEWAAVPLTPEQVAGLNAQIAEGRKQTRGKHYDAAIAAFTAALIDVPNHPRALSGRGYAHLLAGSLPEATRDLEDALPRTQDAALEAAVHFNLGLAAEKRGDAQNAGLHFARSNTLRPSKAAADKLQSGTVCPVEVDDTVKEAALVADWRALWDRWHFYGGDRPASEADARDAMCSQGLPCAGEPPWVVLVKGDDITMRVALVQPARPDGLRVQVLDDELAIPLHCDDELQSLTWDQRTPLLVGSPVIDRGLFFEGGCEDPDAECYGMTCERGSDDYARTVVLDPGNLQRLLVITDHSGSDSANKLEVDATGGRLRGGACDRSFTWALTPATP